MENEYVVDCPCTPKCPNYGKCAPCIAAHKKYYTVPHCIKIMQNEMREKHIHPSNPHVKTTLPERVREYYAANPGEHLRSAAEALKITQWQLLDAYDGAIEVGRGEWEGILTRLSALPAVLLHADCGPTVLQLETKLPEPKNMRGTALFKEGGMTMLLFPDGLYSVFLVRESLYGKESLSIALVGDDERIALSLYLRHSSDGGIDPESKALFEELWKEYENRG